MLLTVRVSLLIGLFPVCVMAEEELLAGWHDFSAGFRLYLLEGSAKVADQSSSGVEGRLWGGDGTRDTWGSNDGTYGPRELVGSRSSDGAMSLRTDRPFLKFSITNNGAESLALGRVVFDFASVSNRAPQNFRLLYDGGDLEVADGTPIEAWNSVLNGLGTVSNYEDVEVSLASLNDRNLAPGESATFNFVPDTATNNVQAMGIDNVAILGEAFDELRVVTYNMHGGAGAVNAGSVSENLTAFRDDFLQGEDVLCLQEVDLGDVWETVQTVFADYPYRFQTINTTTRFSGFLAFLNQQTSVAILSKYPFVDTHSNLVNTDPSIDRWERHGQHVQIEVGGEVVHIFNYHNTFDPEDGGTSSEVAGMERFRAYVLDRLGPDALTESGRVLVMGDFNVNGALVNQLLPDLVDSATDWVDHVGSMSRFTTSGVYSTLAADISDHDAVWAQLDLEAPSPLMSLWDVLPNEAGRTAITMSAREGEDLNGVSYYFANRDFPDGSHDSGWQSSSVYTDIGLEVATAYSYTVQMRDQSENLNEGELSRLVTALTDDGDALSNEWELLHFGNLRETSGTVGEDNDGDRWSDFNEWVAGTNPVNGNSRFDTWTAVNEAGGLELRWNVVEGRNYRVWSSDDLSGEWLLEADGELEGAYPLSVEDSMMFYRVEVSL